MKELQAMRYASAVAYRLHPNSVKESTFDDLVQEGMIEWWRNPSEQALGIRMKRRMIDWLRSWYGRKGSYKYKYTRQLKTLEWTEPPPGSTSKTALQELVAPVGRDRSTEDAVMATEFLSEIAELPERERDAVTYKLQESTLRKIGERYGITESRVSQIRSETIRRLMKLYGE